MRVQAQDHEEREADVGESAGHTQVFFAAAASASAITAVLTSYYVSSTMFYAGVLAIYL